MALALNNSLSSHASEVLRLLTSRLIAIIKRVSSSDRERDSFPVRVGANQVVSLSWVSVVDALVFRVERRGRYQAGEQPSTASGNGGNIVPGTGMVANVDDNEEDSGCNPMWRATSLLRERERRRRGHSQGISSRVSSFVDVLSTLLAQDLVEHLIGIALEEWLLQPLAQLPAFTSKTRAMEEIQAHFELERHDRRSTYHLVLCTFSDLDWGSYEAVREAVFNALTSHLDTAEAMGALMREIGASVIDNLTARLGQTERELEGVQQAMASTVKVFRAQNQSVAEKLGQENASLREQLEATGNDRDHALRTAEQESVRMARARSELEEQRLDLQDLERQIGHGNRQQQLVEELELQVSALQEDNSRARDNLASSVAQRAAEEQRLKHQLQQKADLLKAAEAQAESHARDVEHFRQRAQGLGASEAVLSHALHAQEAATKAARLEAEAKAAQMAQVVTQLESEERKARELHREYQDAEASRTALLTVQNGLREEVEHLASAHEQGVSRAESLLQVNFFFITLCSAGVCMYLQCPLHNQTRISYIVSHVEIVCVTLRRSNNASGEKWKLNRLAQQWNWPTNGRLLRLASHIPLPSFVTSICAF